MALDNYRDFSLPGTDVNAGFQFEFYCQKCSRKWKSPFKPYRRGQISGLLTRFAFLFMGPTNKAQRVGSNFAEMGSRDAKDEALTEARAHAATLYTECRSCGEMACADCYDTREESCKPCLRASRAESERRNDRESEKSQAQAALACPNCRTPGSGGRFCAECGFDMASTHKSCPQCGVMLPRQARFCTDCGHGF